MILILATIYTYILTNYFLYRYLNIINYFIITRGRYFIAIKDRRLIITRGGYFIVNKDRY